MSAYVWIDIAWIQGVTIHPRGLDSHKIIRRIS